jgi:hypothetical protein
MGKQKLRETGLYKTPNRSYAQRHGYVLNADGNWERYGKGKRRIIVNKTRSVDSTETRTPEPVTIYEPNNIGADLTLYNATVANIVNDTSSQGKANEG